MELTTPELLGVLGLLVTLLTTGGGLWWAIMKKVTQIKDELHEHQLYAAENFVTTRQMRSMSEDMAKSFGHMSTQIDGMNTRIDNLLISMTKKD